MPYPVLRGLRLMVVLGYNACQFPFKANCKRMEFKRMKSKITSTCICGKAKAGTFLLLGLFTLSVVYADDILAPAYGFATNHVVGGATSVQDGRVLVADGGLVYKFGGGDWAIPLSYLPQPWAAAFAVQDGTLSFGFGSSAGNYAAPTTLPSSITDKAFIWVDVQDSDKLVRDGNAVSDWYDHREADIHSSMYIRAKTQTTYTTDAPEYATLDNGMKAVYFGGLASGRTMRFVKPDGSNCSGYQDVDSAVKQVFAVVQVSNSYGNIFGSFSDSYLSPFRISKDSSAATSLTSHYFYSGGSGNQDILNEKMIHGRVYLNGKRIDSTTETVEKGRQLIEAEVKALSAQSLVNGFFAGENAARSGGDYLCEAIAFTNRLTETERLLVEAYLMAKWLPDAGKHLKNVKLADGAKYVADVPQGETVETQLALSGTGTAEKTGDGDLELRNCTESEGVEWDLKGGTLTLGAFAPIKVTAGKSVTVDGVVAGPRVEVAALSRPDALEKSGSDHLVINGMPAGVKHISVNGGTLTVRAPRTDSFADESAYEVPFRNGGFEEYSDVIASKRAAGARNESVGNMSGYGWSCAEGLAYVFDYNGWTTGSGAIGGTRSAFNIKSRPPEGTCALIMRSLNAGTTVRSAAFTLAESGDYDLTFKMCGRQGTSYLGGDLRVTMIGGTSTTVIGPTYHVRYTYLDGYLEYRMKFPSLAAGSYRLNLYLAQQSEVVTIDDVHFYKVPANPMVATKWSIPGGDFEATSIPMKAASQRFSADNTLGGWTFTQPDGWTRSLPAVGISTLAMTNTASTRRGFLYNNSREPESGSMQLCFCGNGVAETSITPPAGTYRLEGFISRFGSYGVYPKLSASIVRSGASVVDLGQLSPVNKMMHRVGWPNSFTVDGTETIILRLTAANTSGRVDHLASGLLVDDVELVSATEMELFKDGDCSQLTSSLKSIDASSFGCVSGRARVRTDSEAPKAFGSEMVDGHMMIAVGNRSYLYEDVTLPFAGRYRLSFYTKSRLNDKTGDYRPNPLEVSLVVGAETNILGRVNTYSSKWAQRIYEFIVPSGGVYRVAFQGMNNPTSASAEHEAHIDCISLKQVHETRDTTPPFDEETYIKVAEDSRLETDFIGTNVVRGLKFGTVSLTGIINVKDYPQYLSGTGTFNVIPRGIVVSFR